MKNAGEKGVKDGSTMRAQRDGVLGVKRGRTGEGGREEGAPEPTKAIHPSSASVAPWQARDGKLAQGWVSRGFLTCGCVQSHTQLTIKQNYTPSAR